MEVIFSKDSLLKGSIGRKFEGGLGVTISKQLVELMNGEIWVESPSGISSSNENPGSKFNLQYQKLTPQAALPAFSPGPVL